MKEFFLNFAMHWFNFTYIKTNRHIQTDTSIRVRKFKDWTVPCSRPASTSPTALPSSSQRTTSGTWFSKPPSLVDLPALHVIGESETGIFEESISFTFFEPLMLRNSAKNSFQISMLHHLLKLPLASHRSPTYGK